MKEYTEDKLIEQPAIKLFQELGYERINAYYENYGENSLLGRFGGMGKVQAMRLLCAFEIGKRIYKPELRIKIKN